MEAKQKQITHEETKVNKLKEEEQKLEKAITENKATIQKLQTSQQQILADN